MADVKNITKQASTLAEDLASIDPADLTTVLSVSTAGMSVQSALNQSVKVAGSLQDFTLDDGVKLVVPIHNLVTVSLQVLGGLASRKKLFSDLQLNPVVLDTVETLNSTAREYNSLLHQRLPSELRKLADELVHPIFEGLDMAIACFSTEGGANCHNVTDPKANATDLTSGSERSAVRSVGMIVIALHIAAAVLF